MATFHHFPYEHSDEVGLLPSTLGVSIDIGRYGSLNIDYIGSEETRQIPIFAYIHGGVLFTAVPTCPFDSARAGTMSLPPNALAADVFDQLNAYWSNDRYYSEDLDFGGTQNECIKFAENADLDYTFTY
ncbi:MAG: hypothetical protein ACO39X_04080 [Candidatus Nanopelagicaceae bacterium]